MASVVIGGVAVHEYFFPHDPELLDFSLEFCVHRDVCFVDEIEFCLHRQFDVFENVVDFCPENSEVVFYA